ncbi:MAG: hypothetical protein HYZ27_02295 [Deltaproteobacteria bacterium]|nr:hypothetical protein [Deltaproteobacteria bacterium]
MHVYLAPDLGFLRVHYVLPEGGDVNDAVQLALDQAATWVARTLRETLQLRKAVEVAFRFDKDAMRLQRVEQILAADTEGRVSVRVGPDEEAQVIGLDAADAAQKPER